MEEWMWVLGIFAIAVVIAVIVYALRRFIPGLKGEEIPEDPEEIARENINRLVVRLENEKDEDEDKDEDEIIEEVVEEKKDEDK